MVTEYQASTEKYKIGLKEIASILDENPIGPVTKPVKETIKTYLNNLNNSIGPEITARELKGKISMALMDTMHAYQEEFGELTKKEYQTMVGHLTMYSLILVDELPQFPDEDQQKYPFLNPLKAKEIKDSLELIVTGLFLKK